MDDTSKFGYPGKPFAPPKHAMQGMGEAVAAQEDHNQWHRDHPGEPCPPDMFSMDSWETMERGTHIMDFAGGGTIQPGDSFAKEK